MKHLVLALALILAAVSASAGCMPPLYDPTKRCEKPPATGIKRPPPTGCQIDPKTCDHWPS